MCSIAGVYQNDGLYGRLTSILFYTIVIHTLQALYSVVHHSTFLIKFVEYDHGMQR